MTVIVRTRCVRCKRERRLAPYETLCSACTMQLAKEASVAYDAVRALKDTVNPRRRGAPMEEWQGRITSIVGRALLWIELGHARHQTPHAGCIFCVLT